jgi:uncharacterized protein (TIGR02266 family)
MNYPPHTKRRRFRRRVVRVMVEYISAAGLCRDFATTLGAGGMFIETDEPLHPGARLKLRFQLPGGSDAHDVEGFVAWARRPAHGIAGSAGMGIEFRDRAANARIARALEDLGERDA